MFVQPFNQRVIAGGLVVNIVETSREIGNMLSSSLLSVRRPDWLDSLRTVAFKARDRCWVIRRRIIGWSSLAYVEC